MDLFELCTDELKKNLVPHRKQLQQIEEEQKNKEKKTGKEEQSVPEVTMKESQIDLSKND